MVEAENWYDSLENELKIELDKGINAIIFGGCMKAAKRKYDELSIEELSLSCNSHDSNSKLIPYTGELVDPKYVNVPISKTSFGPAPFYKIENDDENSEEDYIYIPVH